MVRLRRWSFCFSAVLVSASGAENVLLTDVPDYAWHAGCFGTATGNLIAFWDRHGLPEMYTGPTGGGVAPLNSFGANVSIRSLWASQEGLDERPIGKPGHMEDYWQSFSTSFSFESTAPDPYAAAGRAEHKPDCLGDFMGQSQRKYDDLNGECSGNIDGFAFNFWEKNGARRVNYEPPRAGSLQVRDIQSGLRSWSRYRGYDAEVSSQLADVNPTVLPGQGFTFEDLKTEINAGYPVLLILQNYAELSRPLANMPRANPHVHAILAYGYAEDFGVQVVRVRTSWASGDNKFAMWESAPWPEAGLPLRGAITYRPQPRITRLERTDGQVRVEWHGPSSTLFDTLSETSRQVHRYVLERASDLGAGEFTPISEPLAELQTIVPDSGLERAFFRVRLVPGE